LTGTSIALLTSVLSLPFLNEPHWELIEIISFVTILRHDHLVQSKSRDRPGHDYMVVVFTTTYAISTYHHQRYEFESRSWRGAFDTTLCGKVFQRLRQVGGFLRLPRFPPPIKLTAMI
jgi:hypothetical protein